jgi:hypothetical protein
MTPIFSGRSSAVLKFSGADSCPLMTLLTTEASLRLILRTTNFQFFRRIGSAEEFAEAFRQAVQFRVPPQRGGYCVHEIPKKRNCGIHIASAIFYICLRMGFLRSSPFQNLPQYLIVPKRTRVPIFQFLERRTHTSK